MNIFLIRHGESLAQAKGKQIHLKMADHAIPLSPRGVRQAQKAGRFLARYIKKIFPYHHEQRFRIWVSPYKRTRQTANEIEKVLCEKGITTVDREEHILLCEQQFGLFDGIFDEDLAEKFPAEHAHYDKCERFEGRFWARMPLGESRFDVAQRVHQAFGTFHRDEEKYGISNIIPICHGVTLRAFVMMWLHRSPEWFEKEKNPANAAIRYLSGKTDHGYIYKGGGR